MDSACDLRRDLAVCVLTLHLLRRELNVSEFMRAGPGQPRQFVAQAPGDSVGAVFKTGRKLQGQVVDGQVHCHDSGV